MRPPAPATNPRRRVPCPACGVDVAVSKEGRLSRHCQIITGVYGRSWAREWCPSGGTIPEASAAPEFPPTYPETIAQLGRAYRELAARGAVTDRAVEELLDRAYAVAYGASRSRNDAKRDFEREIAESPAAT